MEQKLDLSPLKRFENLENQEFKLTKIGSKRRSMVGVGQSEVGDFHVMTYESDGVLPEQYGAFITGRGFSYLRTSPIVKITDITENSTTFETEGGIYKLEKYPTARPTEDRHCPNEECGVITPIQKLEMKMGGLLCPECRTIVYQPYVDEEFFNERARRYKETVETETDSEGDGQEST